MAGEMLEGIIWKDPIRMCMERSQRDVNGCVWNKMCMEHVPGRWRSVGSPGKSCMEEQSKPERGLAVTGEVSQHVTWLQPWSAHCRGQHTMIPQLSESALLPTSSSGHHVWKRPGWCLVLEQPVSQSSGGHRAEAGQPPLCYVTAT